MQRFVNKVAVVTGAASGIGLATVKRLYAEGACIVAGDIQLAGLASLSTEFDEPERLISTHLDVTDQQSIKAIVDTAVSHFGKLDVMCNNAGVACGRGPINEQQRDDWQRTWEVNVIGVMLGSQYASAHMIERGQGCIVNTASVAGLRSGAGGNAYSASKAAVISLTQTTACDLGQYNIRVNAVCPGLIETGMTAPFFERAKAKGVEHRLGERCELRRAGQPHELAAVIAFLASDDASFITGQAIAVDGGNTASLNMPGMKV